jgi:hypothetical protein
VVHFAANDPAQRPAHAGAAADPGEPSIAWPVRCSAWFDTGPQTIASQPSDPARIAAITSLARSGQWVRMFFSNSVITAKNQFWRLGYTTLIPLNFPTQLPMPITGLSSPPLAMKQ